MILLYRNSKLLGQLVRLVQVPEVLTQRNIVVLGDVFVEEFDYFVSELAVAICSFGAVPKLGNDPGKIFRVKVSDLCVFVSPERKNHDEDGYQKF